MRVGQGAADEVAGTAAGSGSGGPGTDRSLRAVPDVDAFCAAIHPRLVGSLRLYVGDAEVARELAQDALVRVVERWPRVAVMDQPEAWTYRVAFNLARSRLRRTGAERRARVRSGPPATPPPSDLAAALAVRRAVAALPPRQRQAVVLRYFGDLTLAEVATAMGCRPGTVKAHLHQAVAALRLAGLADDDDVAAATPTRSEELP